MLYALLFVLGIVLISAKAKDESTWSTVFSLKDISDLKDDSTADYDGPHIFYRNDTVLIKQVLKKDTIAYGKVDTLLHSIKGKPITCYINDSLFFKTKIKNALLIEKSTYDMPSKLIAVSDIEGNFSIFRDFLINNGVINSDNQWIFEDGHLVLVGDFFDRGLNVTECLWFIYHLEQEAIKYNGYVHFILGNHEIMNMNDNFYYVRNKYFENTYLIQESYENWYKQNTELGRWLRTKNIVEKIGNYLFTHGGISQKVNKLGPSLININSTARNFYHMRTLAEQSRIELINTLFSSKTSPFWFRGYVKEEINENAIDSTLNKYEVDKVVVGHTIVSDVRYFYNEKIIAIDTWHRKGDSEGLLIENGIEYRIEKNGKRSAIK